MEEVDLVVKSILDKVKTLRAAHEERTKIIRELSGHIDQLERERTTFVETYRRKLIIWNRNIKTLKLASYQVFIMF